MDQFFLFARERGTRSLRYKTGEGKTGGNRCCSWKGLPRAATPGAVTAEHYDPDRTSLGGSSIGGLWKGVEASSNGCSECVVEMMQRDMISYTDPPYLL